ARHAPRERVPRAPARGPPRRRFFFRCVARLRAVAAPPAERIDAPLPDAADHVAYAVGARSLGEHAHGKGAARPDAAHPARVVAPLVAPRILASVDAARRFLPLRFARKPRAAPGGERLRFEEAHADDRM